MTLDPAELADDVAALKALLVAERSARIVLDKRASDLDAEVESLKLTIAKLQRERFGSSSERGASLIDQLELQLGELVEQVAQNDAANEIVSQAAGAYSVSPATSQEPPRRKPCAASTRSSPSSARSTARHPHRCEISTYPFGPRPRRHHRGGSEHAA